MKKKVTLLEHIQVSLAQEPRLVVLFAICLLVAIPISLAIIAFGGF